MRGGTTLSFLFGLTGLIISCGFVFVGFAPNPVFGEEPPTFIRFFLVVIGLLFACVSLAAMRHAVCQRRIRATVKPVTAMLIAWEISDGDSTTYEIAVSHDTGRWTVPAYGGRGVRHLMTHGESEGLVWFDPATGKPIALEIEGQEITTYPFAIQNPVSISNT